MLHIRVAHHKNLLHSSACQEFPNPVHPCRHPVNLQPALLVQNHHAEGLVPGQSRVPQPLREGAHERLEDDLKVFARGR